MVITSVVFLFILYLILVTWRPPAVLAAMMSFYALEQWAQVNITFFAANPRVMNYAFGALAVYAFAVSCLRHGPPVRGIPMVAWMILGLVAMSGLSYLWSINPNATREVVVGFLPYIVINVLVVPLTIRNVEDIRFGITTFILVAVPVAIMLLGGDILGLTGRSLAFSQVVVDRYGREIEGGNALAVGTFGGNLVICCAFLRWRGVTKWVGMLRWLLVAVGLALVARSQSRGQMAAAVLVTGFLIALPTLLGLRVRNLGLAVIGGIVLALALPWAVTFSLAEGRFDIREWGYEFSQTRIQFCRDLLEYWLDQGSATHWVFGLGSGSAWHVIEAYPHVIPVELLVELGMVGLAVYLAFMLTLAFICVKLLLQLRRDLDAQSVLLVVIGCWMFESILTLKQGTFLGSFQWMAFSIILARFNIFVRRARQLRAAAHQRAVHHQLGTLSSYPVTSPLT
jgi:hypothetical protein